MVNPRQEERQKIIELAQQGDPDTIAGLLNHKLRPEGVSVQVSRQQDCLSIFLTSRTTPDRDFLVDFIRQSLSKLKVKSGKIAEIRGYLQDQADPVWVEAIELENLALQKALSAWLQESTSLFPWQTETLPEVRTEMLRIYLNAKDTALLPVEYIKAVLKLAVNDILPVPYPSEIVLGIYNWRGEMLWLVDLNRLLGFSSALTPYATEVHAIALQVEQQLIAVVVSDIHDLERHDLDSLQPPSPGLFAPSLQSFVQGYLVSADSIILDVPSILQTFTQNT